MLKRFKLRREERAESELLRILGDHEWWYVMDIGEAGDFGWAGIGSIYPLLVRLERQKVIESQWNEDVHPRRRQYRWKPKEHWEN